MGNIDVELASGAVSLSTGVGNLALKADAVASVTGNTGTGNAILDLGEVNGRVEAKAGTGKVTLKLANSGSQAELTLTSGTGDLNLQFAADPICRFDMKSGVGSISVDGLRGVQVKKNLVGARRPLSWASAALVSSCTPAWARLGPPFESEMPNSTAPTLPQRPVPRL